MPLWHGSLDDAKTSSRELCKILDRTAQKGVIHRNNAARNVLQQRLQSAQAHLNKEAIRVAYLALKEHDQTTGQLNEAFFSAIRAKDYCTSRPQQAAVSLSILQVALYLQNYNTVREYTSKLSHTLGSISPALQYKVHVAGGLERLAARDYGAAASKFANALYVTTTAESSAGEGGDAASVSSAGSSPMAAAGSSSGAGSSHSWSEVLAPEDVALFAAFLSLATKSRSELLALAEHPDALELVPVAREAVVLAAKRADYIHCWKLLQESVFPILQVDVYMALHLQVLQDRIREKFLLQHWQAYQCISFAALQEKVGAGILPHPETQLVQLVQRGRFSPDTRLDLQHQTLVRTPAPATHNRQAMALQKASAQVLDDTYSMVIRLACIEEDLVIHDGTRKSAPRRRYMGAGSATAAFTGTAEIEVDDGGDDDDDDDDDDEEGDEPENDEDVRMREVMHDDMNPEDVY